MNKRMIGAGLLIGLVAGTGAGLVLQASGVASAAPAVVAPEHGGRGGAGEHGEHRVHGGPGRAIRGERLEAAATALGMTTEELRAALADGATLAEVAAAQGIAAQTVIDALVAEVQIRLDEAVATGRLTAEEAAAELEEATTRITAMVENGPQRLAGARGHRGESCDEQVPAGTGSGTGSGTGTGTGSGDAPIDGATGTSA